jgi:hypothetical protein
MKPGIKNTVQLGRHAVCTPDQEHELTEHVLRLAKLSFCVTHMEPLRLLYYFTEKYFVKHTFTVG